MADGKEEVSDTEAGLDGAPPSFKVEVPEEPDQALTMRLIRKCCASKWTAGSDSAEALLATKVLRLDFQRIPTIDNLEVFHHITDLYLQHNRIRVLENLECLAHLKFLALAHNQIEKIQNIKHLAQLEFLDLSHNRISSFCVGEVPSSVVVLNLLGNACCDDDHYRLQLVLNMKNLKMLDKTTVESDERRMLQSVLGLPVDPASDEEDDDSEDGDDDDDGEGGMAVPSARAEAEADESKANVPRDASSMPTDPSEVLKFRQQLKERAAKHTAELEALRKELAATSITRLDTLAAERIEAATQGLHDRSAEIVRNSKTRQAQDHDEFEHRPAVADRD